MTTQQLQDFLIAYAIDRMTEFLIEDYGLSITESLNFIYNSETYQKLVKTTTGLYEQSPSYIYELLERNTRREVQLDISVYMLSIETLL